MALTKTRLRKHDLYVKQVFLDNPPPKFGGQISPPKFGGYGLSGERQRGVENLKSEGWDPDCLLPPPPPFVHALSFSFEERGTDQTNRTISGLQNWFWRGCSAVRFPPPPIARYVLPPISRFPIQAPKKIHAQTSQGASGAAQRALRAQRLQKIKS